MFDKTEIVPKREDCTTFFDSAFMSIKSDLCDVANLYLNIAFKVYEIDLRIRKDGKKCKYKNIVEACELELGFKKSTTYNMLNIVKTYGLDDKGQASYQKLCSYSHFSYSQLVEMLSLGSEQRALVTPDTPVSTIRTLKKSSVEDNSQIFQTSGNFDEPLDVVQTSGKVVDVSENSSGQLEISPLSGSVSDELLSFVDCSSVLKIVREDGDLYIQVNNVFFDLVDYLADFFSYLSLSPPSRFLKSSDLYNISLSEVFEKFNAFYPVFSRTLNAYSKLEK